MCRVAVGCALAWAALFSLPLGCGAASTEVVSSSPALSPAPVPAGTEARQAALDGAGRRFYSELSRGSPENLLFDDMALRSLLVPEAATRASARKADPARRLGVRKEAFALLRDAKFLGVCVQGSRLEPTGSPIGLVAAGWMFDRILIVGQQPSGRRVALWLEGHFLHTTQGFGAIALDRVEEPRWEHSDLELAPCDMEVGVHDPQHIVGVIY